MKPVLWATLFALLSPLSGRTVEAATLTGTVTWAKPRAPVAVAILKDHHVCGAKGPIFDIDVDVDKKGRIEGAIVWIDDAPAAPELRTWDVAIDQHNCRFVPRAAAATVGSTLKLRSSDPVLHNVHLTDDKGRTVANYAMPVMGQVVPIKLDRPGQLTVRCDAGHTWMKAALRVFDHPFFTVTDARGAFVIRDLAPGPHKLVAWHPDLGKTEQAIVVEGDGTLAVELKL